MKKILVIFDCDNGYKCSCCGDSWQESTTCEIEDDKDENDFVNLLEETVKKTYAESRYGKYAIHSAYVISEIIREEK
jgi:hypothetical protein